MPHRPEAEAAGVAAAVLEAIARLAVDVETNAQLVDDVVTDMAAAVAAATVAVPAAAAPIEGGLAARFLGRRTQEGGGGGDGWVGGGR